jgi:predicted dinucleotide-binding enzyme
MNVGILGTGDVGRALGRGFIALGYAVKMGARDARNEKPLAWAQEVGAKCRLAPLALPFPSAKLSSSPPSAWRGSVGHK